MSEFKSIFEYLPQQYPFVMIDRVVSIEHGEKSVVLKNVTTTEFWVPGHFRGKPIFPGTLMIEAMAQAGGLIFVDDESGKKGGMITAVNDVKFLKTVVPGDTLIIESEKIAQLGKQAKVKSEIKINDKVVAKGTISYAFE